MPPGTRRAVTCPCPSPMPILPGTCPARQYCRRPRTWPAKFLAVVDSSTAGHGGPGRRSRRPVGLQPGTGATHAGDTAGEGGHRRRRRDRNAAARNCDRHAARRSRPSRPASPACPWRLRTTRVFTFVAPPGATVKELPVPPVPGMPGTRPPPSPGITPGVSTAARTQYVHWPDHQPPRSSRPGRIPAATPACGTAMHPGQQ